LKRHSFDLDLFCQITSDIEGDELDQRLKEEKNCLATLSLHALQYPNI
jgi:hypothetical protein